MKLAIPNFALRWSSNQAVLGAALVLGYAVLHRAVFAASRMPEHVYAQPWLLPTALREPEYLILFVSTLSWIALFARRTTWSKLEDGKPLRVFIFFTTLASAWTFSLYQYNAYYDQAHTLTRLSMLICSLLVLFHPGFAFAYVLIGTLVVSQFHEPIPGYNWLDKRVLFDVLIFFGVFLAIHPLRHIKMATFCTVLVGLVAVDYVVPGIAKLSLDGWITEDDLTHLTFATWHNGWMWWWDEAQFLKILEAGAWANRPLIIATLIGELGFAFVLLHRWVFRALFIFSFGLHAGIFVSSGIFFWKWMLLNLLLIFLIERLSAPTRARLFHWRSNVGLLAVVLASGTLVAAPWLAWYDTPYSEIFRLEVTGVSGRTYRVPRLFMAPYSLIFAQNRFFYLLDEPHLVGTFGATIDRELHGKLVRARSREEVDALMPLHGRNEYDAQLAQQYDAFLQQYFGTLNRRQVKKAWYSRFRTPHHIWSRPRAESVYDMQEAVTKCEVLYSRALYADGKILRWDRRTIRSIPIPSEAAH